MYILRMDSSGHVFNKWNISSEAQTLPIGFFFIDSRFANPMVLKKNILYCQASYHTKPGLTIEQQIPIEIALDLNSGLVRQFGDIPEEYKKGVFYGNHQDEYARQFNDKSELIYSFPSCHDLFVYDTSGTLLKTVNCKSKFIHKFEPLKKEKYHDIPAIIDAYSYNARYSDFIYDKYRKTYYRIVLHKLNKLDKNNHKNDFRKRKWSVMILDEELQFIAEVMVPEDQFLKRLFVLEEGLALKPIADNDNNTFNIYTPCTK